MSFISLQFLLFFMVVTLSYYRLPDQKKRIVLLLAASCYFYMCFIPRYILILGTMIVIDYIAGLKIAGNSGQRRKTWLIVSIIANVGILAFFKYFNFFLGNIEPFIHLVFPDVHVPALYILLPIGLSFHTFQAMSYTIEVYRGNQPPERNFLVYALYVMFYPQLVAGPIERPQNVFPQLHRYQPYDWNNIKEGLARMLWGFFKKTVIADRLAIAVDYSFDHSHLLSSKYLMAGALFYSFQIYCDFSGYCDIGIGAAKVMGVRLMENFNEPYGSYSIAQFWGRWHISLSSWFRDYVYIPLGGSRRGEKRRRSNVLIVFLLSGLWHGANWTFVVWGGLHGMLTAFLPGNRKNKKEEQRPGTLLTGGSGSLKNVLLVGINFLLVTLLWVFFRSPHLKEALDYLGGIFSFRGGIQALGLNNTELALSVVLIAVMLLREHRYNRFLIKSDLAFACYCTLMVVVCYFLGVFNENQFIYFQF